MATSLAPRIRIYLPELHAGQRRVRRLIAKERARFAVIMCGRRWGKTTDGIEWLSNGALEWAEPCAWMAPTYKLMGEAWRELVSRLRPAAEQVSEQDHRILLYGGGSIECWTLDSADPARGRKYARVVIDEAGVVRNLKDIWEAAIRPTLVDLGGHARFYGTPKGRRHGFVTLFAKGEQHEAGWASARAPTNDNPYIPQSEIDAARADLPPAVFAQEFEGQPADDLANPFGVEAVAAALAPMSSDPPEMWGWDFARAQDWTVGIALDAGGTVCRFERWQHTPWGETKARVAMLTGRTLAVGDATGVGDSVVEDLQRLHVRMQPYVFTPKSKQQLMERLAGAIQGREIHFPDGVIRSELETFEFEYTAHGVRYSAPEGLHDDAVMALALAVYGYDRHYMGRRHRRAERQAQREADEEDFDIGAKAVLQSEADRTRRFHRVKSRRGRGDENAVDDS